MSSPAPFYGNSGTELGSVVALPQSTFASFVKEVLGTPALVNLHTREEFRALPKDRRTASKRVPYFTPAAFSTERSPRNYAAAVHCNLICLDIDNPDHAAPFLARPQTLIERLYPFAFAAYTTASSTPEKPRMRIVVSASAIALANYGNAVRWVGETLLGLPEVTSESRVSVQPMFLPTLFRGDDPVGDHPLFIAVPEGAAVTATQVTANVVGAAAPSGNNFSNGASEDATGPGLLDFLRPAVEGITVEDVSGALAHLDPDCNYGEWVEVAAALRHQFPIEPEATAAFNAFNEWSAAGDKYTDEEDTRKKWDSFRTNPRGRIPITIRSVFRRAAAAGWQQAEELATRCYNDCVAWLRNPDRTGTELMANGVQRIVAAPMITTLQKGALLSLLHTALKVRNVGVTRTELKHALHRLEQAAARQDMGAISATPDAQMPPWARGICYVAGQDEFFQKHSGRKFKPPVLDSYFSVQLMTPANTENGLPLIRPRDYLLNVQKCPRADDYTYDPSATDTFITEGKRRTVNLYIPTHPEPNVADSEVGEIFLAHIRRLVLEPEYQRMLMDYLAYMVQFPGRKIRWAVLLQGAQGCGKTTLAEAMRAVLGKEHVRSIGAELLFTGFNGWAMGAQLVAIEEVRVVGHNRYEVMNALKPVISNDYISINEKFQRTFQTKNVTNYLMFTNHLDSLAVTSGDRRYFVLNSPLATREDVEALPAGYFDKLWDIVRNHAGGLRAWLENWEISESFNPHGHAPVTKYLLELAENSSSPLAGGVVEAIKSEVSPLVRGDLVSLTALHRLMMAARIPYCTEQTLAAVLREQGYSQTHRTMLGGERHRLWVHNSSPLMKELHFVPRVAQERHDSDVGDLVLLD